MTIKVSYMSEPNFGKNGGQPAQSFDLSYTTIIDARQAALPEGAVFAFFKDGNGAYAYSKSFGCWEYHEALG